MPSYNKGGGSRGNFGKNVWRRSTLMVLTESYTVAASTVPLEDVGDGTGVTQKVLQPGEVLAKIVNGAESGKVGPFMAAGTKEVQTETATGTVSGGTYTLTFNGQTTANIAWNAANSAIQSALEALSTIGVGNIAVTGGPFPGTPVTLTFQGTMGGNQPQITATTTNLTGSTPGITMATSTPGTTGAVDGRGDTANIVGINDTFLPWQLLEHDVEVAAAYDAVAVQGWCYERDGSGARVVLSNTTADAMRGTKTLDVKFH